MGLKCGSCNIRAPTIQNLFSSSNGQGDEGYEGHEGHEEEGRDEAPRHEGSSSSSREGHEEEGSDEAPCHEGSGSSSREGHEEEESNEGHEGYEEVREAPCPQPHMISVAQAAEHLR